MTIKFDNGAVHTFESLNELVKSIRDNYPEAVLYDTGGFEVNTDSDLRDGGDILVWASEEASNNDDGSRAIARITQ